MTYVDRNKRVEAVLYNFYGQVEAIYIQGDFFKKKPHPLSSCHSIISSLNHVVCNRYPEFLQPWIFQKKNPPGMTPLGPYLPPGPTKTSPPLFIANWRDGDTAPQHMAPLSKVAPYGDGQSKLFSRGITYKTVYTLWENTVL